MTDWNARVLNEDHTVWFHMGIGHSFCVSVCPGDSRLAVELERGEVTSVVNSHSKCDYK